MLHGKEPKLVCVHYYKFLRAANIHRKFCTPGLNTILQSRDEGREP